MILCPQLSIFKMNDITLSERIKLTLANIPSEIKKQFSFMLHQKV